MKKAHIGIFLLAVSLVGVAYAGLSTRLAVTVVGVSVNAQQMVSGNGKLSQLLTGVALCDGWGHHHHERPSPPDPPPVGGVR